MGREHWQENFFIHHEEIWTSLLQGRSSLVKKRWKVERMHVFTISSTLFSFMEIWVYVCFHFPSARSPLIFHIQQKKKNSYTADMLVIKSLSLPLSKNCFSSPSFLKDIFAGYRIQGWQFFISFRASGVSLPCLLVYLGFEVSNHSYFCFSDCLVSFGLWLLLRHFLFL